MDVIISRKLAIFLTNQCKYLKSKLYVSIFFRDYVFSPILLAIIHVSRVLLIKKLKERKESHNAKYRNFT